MSNGNDTETPIAGHEYDGIQELDNPLPMWWLVTFFGTIIFAFIYWIHYQAGGGGLSSNEELKSDMAAIEASKPAPSQGSDAQVDLNALIGDATALSQGKTVFAARCAACHGPNGEGQIGPNLTDNYWIHGGGQIADVIQVVKTGVTAKGMPAWETMISGAEINSVAAYIVSLKGSNPANAKAAEGTEVK